MINKENIPDTIASAVSRQDTLFGHVWGRVLVVQSGLAPSGFS